MVNLTYYYITVEQKKKIIETTERRNGDVTNKARGLAPATRVRASWAVGNNERTHTRTTPSCTPSSLTAESYP